MQLARSGRLLRIAAVRLVLCTAGLIGGWAVPASAQPADRCRTCHLTLDDARLATPARDFQNDVHQARGFTCADCHGGNPARDDVDAMDPARGFIGVPTRQNTPQLCGTCHSDAVFMKRYNPTIRIDQITQYWISAHGRRLWAGTDPNVAVCTSCHGTHHIRPGSDPTSGVNPLHLADTCGRCHSHAASMAAYGLATDQVTKYKASVHWNALSVKGDLAAPTCNGCHGNHGVAPPGVRDVVNVCRNCHSVPADDFARSPHAAAFAAAGLPGCITCHENHAIKAPSEQMLGVQQGATCADCHTRDEPAGRVATEMRLLIDQLRARTDSARSILQDAERAGMDVSDAQFSLNQAHEGLVKARAAVHTLVPASVEQAVGPALAIAQQAYQRGVDARRELLFRRNGLAVSVGIIYLVIAGLVLKIRQIERRPGGGPRVENGHE